MCGKPTHGESVTAERAGGQCRCRRSQAVLLIEFASPVHGAPVDEILETVSRERAEALERALPKGWRVLYAIHHGRPTIAAALAEAREAGVERLVVVPMRPQFSESVTGDELHELYRCLGESAPDMHVDVRTWWHDDTVYLDGHARLIHAHATRRNAGPDRAVLVFWAAGVNDPGADADSRRLSETADLLRRRIGWPVERAVTLLTGPGRGGERASLERAVESLGVEEGTRVLVCPLTHMSDGQRLREELHGLLAPMSGLRANPVEVCPAPNASDEMIKTLTLLVRRGREPAGDARSEPAPLFAPTDLRAVVEREIGTLIMAGVCVKCSLGRAGGPALRHCEHEELLHFKRPHTETVELLRRAAERVGARECWIWNTCSRYEFYAWLPKSASPERCLEALQIAAEEVLGQHAGEHANLLLGREAWTHALRTASGLNSSLVGDAEVVEQLRAARSAAQYAGTAGELTDAFIEGIGRSVRELREQTAWGKFEHRYCDVALSRLSPLLGASVAKGRCVVVGGSTTSCSALETLAGRFGVPTRQLSLMYRGHRKGALIKRLHAAVGDGTMAVVEDYADPAVLEAVAAADLVIFAIDQRDPVFTGHELARVRGDSPRPQTIVDFNTFGSVAIASPIPSVRYIDAAHVDAQVAAFNRELIDDAALAGAARDAEKWIAAHVEPARRAGGSHAQSHSQSHSQGHSQGHGRDRSNSTKGGAA